MAATWRKQPHPAIKLARTAARATVREVQSRRKVVLRQEGGGSNTAGRWNGRPGGRWRGRRRPPPPLPPLLGSVGPIPHIPFVPCGHGSATCFRWRHPVTTPWVWLGILPVACVMTGSYERQWPPPPPSPSLAGGGRTRRCVMTGSRRGSGLRSPLPCWRGLHLWAKAMKLR